MTRKQENVRKDEGAASRILITDATFIFIDAMEKHFTVFEGGEYLQVKLRERNQYNLQELYDEMNHLTSFRPNELVDLVVIPKGTTYFLVSIKRSDDARKR